MNGEGKGRGHGGGRGRGWGNGIGRGCGHGSGNGSGYGRGWVPGDEEELLTTQEWITTYVLKQSGPTPTQLQPFITAQLNFWTECRKYER